MEESALVFRGVLVANAPAVDLEVIGQLVLAKRGGPEKLAGVDAGQAVVYLVVMVCFQELLARGCPVCHGPHVSGLSRIFDFPLLGVMAWCATFFMMRNKIIISSAVSMAYTISSS